MEIIYFSWKFSCLNSLSRHFPWVPRRSPRGELGFTPETTI